jgi:hypothetical protein
MRICCVVRRTWAAILIFLLSAGAQSIAQVAQAPTADELVTRMEKAEGAARSERQQFLYRSKERSVRTGGHLWDELVIETSDGRIRRLLAIDGKALSGPALSAEENRLTNIANHPDEYRREGQALREDENRLGNILKQVPKLYVFRMDGSEGDCVKVAFDPNPQFQEQSFQDRILHAMSGVLYINNRDDRLCGIDAHLDHTVEFGFGLLGKVNAQSHFSVRRQQILPGQWKNTRIIVHVDGRLLLLKSVAREEDATHYDFKSIPQDLNASQAAALVRSTNPQYEANKDASH